MRVYRTQTVVDNAPDGKKYRGAQAWHVSASSLTVRVQLEHHFVGDRTVERALAPEAITGDALAAEITGTGAADYQIVALYPARFAAVSGSNDSVRKGEFCPGHIGRELSGDPGYVPWFAGLLRDR